MKKLTSILLIAALAVSVLAGCGAKAPAPGAAGGIEGTATEIIDKIYEKHEAIDLSLMTMEVDISDADALLYYTGLQSAENVEEAAVSETMLGQPYSLVIVRLKDGADAAKVAQEMFNGIDTRKWICVAADTSVAAYSGNVVMFFMINSEYSETATTESMAAAFNEACGGTAVVIQ